MTLTPDSTCLHCDQPTRVVLTEGDRRWKVDVDPSPDGTLVLVERHGKIRGHVLSGAELPAQATAYTDHDRTCPEGAERIRRAIASAPRCLGCGLAMDRELTELEGWTHHPCCDPEYVQMVAGWKRRTRRGAA